MDQLKKIFENLSIRQRITIAVAALAVFGGMFAFSRWRTESDFRPLYTAMSPEDASAVLQKVKETGTPYRLAENGTGVLVPSSRLAELRLDLAGAGLPKTGRLGFEIFDKTNLGATEFVEHINYHRALEGELERSVMSLAEVEQARIHLTFPKDSVFLEAQQPAKASIMVKLKPGARLSAHNVTAISNLVASAVEGLAPEAVSVVDMNGNLLSRPRKPGAADDAAATGEVIELRQKLERDLVAKITSTLDPLLGPERFRAGASVDCDVTSGEQSEETFDPAKSVMLTSQKTEDSTATAGSTGGVPGTASNLPRPASSPIAGGLASLVRTTENITYQTSHLTKHTRIPLGAIKRMSISVLVDHSVRWEGEGARRRRVLVPPTAEALKSIREVVAAVTGVSTDRGDQLIVESLPFESTLNWEPPAQAPAPAKPLGFFVPQKLWLPIGAAAALLVLLLATVLMKLRKRKRADVEMRPALTADEQAELEEGEEADVIALESGEAAQLEESAMPKISELMSGNAAKMQKLTELVREAVTKDSAGACNIVRAWISDDEI